MTKRSSDAAGIKSEPKPFSEICALCLRKGKWTDEEEKYASTIIVHFESNLLPLSEQRESTIRLYLGKKLHCDPMRISKKFAGKDSVGKHFFCKKQEEGQNQSAAALDAATTEREQMRLTFVESVEKEFDAASKRPKRIRIRNRKKKPEVNVENAAIFQWDDSVLGDLQTLLDDDSVKTEGGFVVTPRGSPEHEWHHHPLTPPFGPVQATLAHDNFALDGHAVCAPTTPAILPPQAGFSGAFVEPQMAGTPPHQPPSMSINVPYGYMIVCGPPQQQAWTSAPMLPYGSVQAAAVTGQQVVKEAAFDACLDDILGNEADGFEFLDSI